MKTTREEREALFDAWLAENPRVYSEVVARARRAKERGHRLGIRCIWEAIRYDWSVAVRHEEGAPRLNDWFTAPMARRAMQREPDLADYFNLRGDAKPEAVPEPEPLPYVPPEQAGLL